MGLWRKKKPAEIFLTENKEHIQLIEKNLETTIEQIEEGVKNLPVRPGENNVKQAVELLKAGEPVYEGLKYPKFYTDEEAEIAGASFELKELIDICPFLKGLFSAGITGYYYGKDSSGKRVKVNVLVPKSVREALLEHLKESKQ